MSSVISIIIWDFIIYDHDMNIHTACKTCLRNKEEGQQEWKAKVLLIKGQDNEG